MDNVNADIRSHISQTGEDRSAFQGPPTKPRRKAFVRPKTEKKNQKSQKNTGSILRSRTERVRIYLLNFSCVKQKLLHGINKEANP